MNDDRRQEQIAEIADDRSQRQQGGAIGPPLAADLGGDYRLRRRIRRLCRLRVPQARPAQGDCVAAARSPAATAADLPQQAAANSKAAGNLAASGYVVARRKATVAAEITGKVVEVFIDEGMTVTEGQVVARLDSVLAEKDYELARSRVETADAAIAAITADLEDATRIMTRVQTLSQKNFATEADLTKAQARVGVLSAQLRQAQSQFETARIDAKRSASVLDKHQIRAPFAGVVVDRSAQPGEMISPMSVGGYTRTGICTIVDMDSIEIEVDVNEAFIGRVVPGGAVNAMLDAYPDWTIPASVIAIVPTANREKATVKVRIRFEKKDPRILPDMAVKVNFLADAKNNRAKGAESHRRELASSRKPSKETSVTAEQPMVRLTGVAKRFTKGKETISIFDHLDLAIPRGDFIAVMGPSGSGKTTLLNLLGGIDRADAGEIAVADQRIDGLSEGELAAWRAANIGFIFQFYNLMPMLTAAQNVELPLLLTRLKPQGARRARSDRAVRGRARRPHQAPAARNVGRTAAARGDCARHRLRSEPAAVRRTDRRSRPRNPPTRSCRSCNCSTANSARPS